MQLVIYMSKKYNKLPNIEILDEKDKRLKQKSENVTFPLPKEDLQRIEDMLTYLEMSQIDEYNQKYNLRAGWGLAYIQLGIPKRIIYLKNTNYEHILPVIPYFEKTGMAVKYKNGIVMLKTPEVALQAAERTGQGLGLGWAPLVCVKLGLSPHPQAGSHTGSC